MAINDADRLGKFLGGMANNIENVEQQISPNESEPFEQVFATFNVLLRATGQVLQKPLRDDILVVDHAVYGYIDDNSFYGDGVYDVDSPDFDNELVRVIL